MFVTAREDNGVGYFIGIDRVAYNWNGNYGGLKFKTGYSPNRYTELDIKIATSGENGRKTWTAPNNSVGVYTDNIANMFKDKSIEILFILKFPNPENSESIIFEIHDATKLSSPNGGSSVFVFSIWANSNSTNINWNTSNIYPYLSDDSSLGGDNWYPVKLKIDQDGTSELYLNDSILGSGMMDRSGFDSSDQIVFWTQIFSDILVDSIVVKAL